MKERPLRAVTPRHDLWLRAALCTKKLRRPTFWSLVICWSRFPLYFKIESTVLVRKTGLASPLATNENLFSLCTDCLLIFWMKEVIIAVTSLPTSGDFWRLANISRALTDSQERPVEPDKLKSV